jgi:signal transduction histidine kinase
MSINKKMLIFVTILVIVPMLILSLISTFVLNNQVEKSAQNYLENALKIARNQMISRLEKMEKGCRVITQSYEFQKKLEDKNTYLLKQKIVEFKEVYNFLDFILILDQENKLLVSQPRIKKPNFPQLAKLIEKARTDKETITSEQVFPLTELFDENSEQFDKFKVKISNNKEDNYLLKCQAGVIVTPVFNKFNKNLIGFLVVGDITNNDDFFPKTYSMNVKDSYLAISIDGIRITSNIRSPKNQNFIGSTIPITMNTLEGPRDSYFGRVNIDNEIHVFLDEPILDYEGNVIGVLGVGIPEHKFSVLIDTNQNIIFIVTLTCLFLMLILGRSVSKRITKPIIKATEFAEQIAKGKNDLVLEDWLVKDKKSETTILLKTFQKMANDIKKSEEKQKTYLEELEEKNIQQENLTNQLKLLNDELEEKVEARTQDLRQAIFALKKADEVKSRFLANMSHELRTPLNAIICSSEALKDRIFGTLNEKQEKYIQNIINSSTHLLQLINDILDISKIEAGKMTLSLGLYSIANIVEDSFSIVKTLAYRKNINVSIKIVPPDFKIRVDAKKLKQILYNLLSNAIKFTPENGEVTLEILKLEDFIKIIVKDTGIGIKEEDQERVFREFEQVDGSYERQYEGTGLGLPLTKKLVEMHGGEIYLTSKVGEGTEVLFTIPIDIETSFNGSTNISKVAGNFEIYTSESCND